MVQYLRRPISPSVPFKDTENWNPVLLNSVNFPYTERMWLEQGRKVGEHVIPLARNFNGMSTDLESGRSSNVCDFSFPSLFYTSHIFIYVTSI